MPRVGKKIIPVPDGVQVTITGQHVSVKGPKGTLEREFHRRAKITQEGNTVSVDMQHPEEKRSRELWGTTRVLIANMIQGVTAGYSKQLEINGVGYRAAAVGSKLTLNVGYSHPVEFIVPAGITVSVQKNVVTIAGIDKQVVGQIAAQIRDIRKPEPYKGKGIKYSTEIVRRKAGKVVKAAGS